MNSRNTHRFAFHIYKLMLKETAAVNVSYIFIKYHRFYIAWPYCPTARTIADRECGEDERRRIECEASMCTDKTVNDKIY